MRKQRLAALFCAVTFLFTAMVPTGAAHEDGIYSYSANDYGVTLTRVANAMDADCVLPETLGGAPVVALGARIFSGVGGYYLETLTIPSGVTELAPDFVGRYARSGRGLRELRVAPGNTAFEARDGVLYSADGKTLVYYPCGRTDAEFTVPSGVTHIGGYAFSYSTALRRVVLPEGLESIGDHAFAGSGLTEIALPGTLDTLGDSAFSGTALSALAIPASVSAIGKDVLRDCENVASLSFAGGAVPEGFARDCDRLTALTLADGVTAIGADAFHGCTGLTAVEIPGSVQSVGAGAFDGCWNLASVTIGDGVKALGSEAFAFCSDLTTLTLPDSLESLGEKAFYKTGLTEFTAPTGLTALPDYLLCGCKALTSVTLPDSVQTLGEGMLLDCAALKTVALPSSIREVPDYCFSGCSALQAIVIPEGAARIGKGAFRNCDALRSAGLPESLTALDSAAFQGCRALASIELPDGVTVLPDMAFSFCWSLQSIKLPAQLEIVHPWAFEQCKALQTIEFPASLHTLDRLSMSYMPALRQVTFLGDAPISTDVNYASSTLSNPLLATEARQTITLYHAKDAAGFWPGSIWEAKNIVLSELADGGAPEGPAPLDTQVALSAVLSHSRQDELILWLTVDITPKSYEADGLSDPSLVPTGALTATINGEALPDPIHFVSGGSTTHRTFGYAITDVPEGTLLTVSVRLADSIGFTGSESNTLTGRVVWPAWDKDLPFIEGDAGALTPEQQYRFAPDAGGEGVMITEVLGELTGRTLIELPATLDGKPVTALGDGLFAGFANLSQVTLPRTVERLGDGVFANCPYLLSTPLPKTLETLPANTFAGCPRLTYVKLPETLREIGPRAFVDCTRITELTVPANVEQLAADAFAGCALQTITFQGDAPAFNGAADAFGPDTLLCYPEGASGFDRAPWTEMRGAKPAPETPDNGANDSEQTPPDNSADGDTQTPPEADSDDGAQTPPDTDTDNGAQTPPDSGSNGDTQTPPDNDASGDTQTPPDSDADDGTQTPPDSDTDDSTQAPPDTGASGNTPTPPTGGASSNRGDAAPKQEIPTAQDVVTLTEQVVENAVKAATEEPVLLRAETEPGKNAVSVAVPDMLFPALAARETPAVTIETPVAAVSLDAGSLRAIEAAGAKDVVVSAEKLAADAPEADPAYEIRITAGGQEVSRFDGGTVKVALPYVPGEAVNPDSLVACWLRDDGTSEIVRSSAWANGKLVFATNHLSRYAIISRPASFIDTSGSAASFAAARGLLNGVGNGRFDPDGTATGAMALAVLGRLSGVSDADAIQWQPAYCAWAEAQHLLPADFEPDAALTRETLRALLATRFGDTAAEAAVQGLGESLTRADLAEAARRALEADLHRA